MRTTTNVAIALAVLAFTACAEDPNVVANRKLLQHDIEGARQMYASGRAEVNAQYEDGFTILMHVMKSKNDSFVEEAIDMLVSVGADVDERDNRGRTALHYAAYLDNKKAIEVLLRNGADPNAKDRDGRTPEQLAAARDAEGTSALFGGEMPSEK